MNTTAAGWFPDPEGQASLRYWDGGSWTDHTHNGDEPQEPSAPQHPPSAAGGGDDGVLLQADLSMPMRKGRTLVMDETALHWGDTIIRYADVTGFAYLITSQSVSGVPSTTAYQVDVHTGSGRTRIAFTAASVRSGRVKGERQDLWLTIVGILSEKVEPRLIREFTERIAAGGQVVIGPLTLDQRGITAKRTAAAPIAKVLNSRMTPKAAPWSSYLDTGFGHGNGMTEIYVADRGSRKGRSRIAVMPNLEPSSGLLPDLLRTLAVRFATH